MATLKTIRKRITSVRNTQKITKAMKMVSAAKLRRAQQAVLAVRPYADALKGIVRSMADRSLEMPHPFFHPRAEPKKMAILVYTSNRGLCGGFNSNLLRRTEAFLKRSASQYETMELSVIGKKGRDFFKSRKREMAHIYPEFADKFPLEEAGRLADQWLADFTEGKFDEIYIAYSGFKSALAQDIRIQKIIPYASEANDSVAKDLTDFLYEPSRDEFVEAVVPRYIATELFRAHRESLAAELGARMTAMENATNNARDMIRLLTLQYNRLRQAAITRELMDIVNGAEAIK